MDNKPPFRSGRLSLDDLLLCQMCRHLEHGDRPCGGCLHGHPLALSANKPPFRPLVYCVDLFAQILLGLIGVFLLAWAFGVKSLVGALLDGAMGWFLVCISVRYGVLASRWHARQSASSAHYDSDLSNG